MTTPTSTPTSTPPITGVTGGIGGLAASYAEMRALADRLARVGDRLRECAAQDARALADPDLVESVALSPVTFAEAEGRVLEAMSGPHGALELAWVAEGEAVLVRGVVAGYQSCDEVVATAFHGLDYAVGRGIGCAIDLAGPELAAFALAGATAWGRLPPEERRRLGDGLESWVDDHPAVVQHAVDGSGGFLDGLLTGVPATIGATAFHPSTASAAAQVAGLYPDEGRPHVGRRDDLVVPLGRRPPDDLHGLLRHLAQTNRLSTPDRPDDQGTIEIQTLRDPDGAVRHVVYLPGTDQLTTLPWSDGTDVRDLPEDLRVIAGGPSTYAAGIERAMTEAGIGPHDPVLLVGHSLGGMAAASLLAGSSGFHVTHVVTAGSPIGGIVSYPAGTHVLSLENAGDVVPLLDGRDNADSVEHVTVRFDDHETSISGNHALHHYVAGAHSLEASRDPSVREQLDSLRRQGFLASGSTATSQVFQITR